MACRWAKESKRAMGRPGQVFGCVPSMIDEAVGVLSLGAVQAYAPYVLSV
jgi:hypothetical protein